MTIIRKLQEACGYDPLGEGAVDYLIAYKDELEDLVGRVDEVALANAGDPAAEAYRRRRGESTISAADVTGALFSMGFGEVPDGD